MVGPWGNVKVIDFGSAKDLQNPKVKGAGTHNFNSVLEASDVSKFKVQIKILHKISSYFILFFMYRSLNFT